MKYLDLAIANETIKTTDIKGKEYAEVNQRIKAFRMVYPQGSIFTEMISNENGVCIFRARVMSDKGELLGTGTAYEKEDSNYINKTSYIENCETSAVGRALGMAGFGIDVSVASAEEVQNAIENQKITKEDAEKYIVNFGRNKGKTFKEIEESDPKWLDWLINNTQDENMIEMIRLATGREIPSFEESELRIKTLAEINDLVLDTDTDLEEIHNHFKVKSLNQLTIIQLEECKKILEKKLEKKESE